MKHFRLTFTAITVLGATSFLTMPHADETPAPQITHVVELFTSQGCSSCPPANQTIAQISDEPGVLALSYGVTYWDYLGWEDTFGDPKFTERQRDYRQALDGANLYTPQIVLNGSAHSPRYDASDIRSMPLPKTDYRSDLQENDTGLLLSSTLPKGGVIAVVTYKPGIHEVPVKRGENSGRTLKIANVVTDIQQIDWTGEAKMISAPREGEAIAALFHDPSTSKIRSVATYTPK